MQNTHKCVCVIWKVNAHNHIRQTCSIHIDFLHNFGLVALGIVGIFG
jgi:hypothetical protein